MPIKNIEQPEIIVITNKLRLRKYDGVFDFALKWYQDEETLLSVNNTPDKYDMDRLKRMYTFLANQGEEYFIEIIEGETFVPIGDVTFWKDDMPIVIGEKKYRGKGIGKLVITTLINRAKTLGYGEIRVDEIYKFNISSQKLFESCGFTKYEETEKGYRYCYKISN